MCYDRSKNKYHNITRVGYLIQIEGVVVRDAIPAFLSTYYMPDPVLHTSVWREMLHGLCLQESHH